MATDVSDFVGVENMQPDKLRAVIAILRGLDTTEDTRKFILLRWGREVNRQITTDDLVGVMGL